jgi:hypothetical protein
MGVARHTARVASVSFGGVAPSSAGESDRPLSLGGAGLMAAGLSLARRCLGVVSWLASSRLATMGGAGRMAAGCASAFLTWEPRIQ